LDIIFGLLIGAVFGPLVFIAIGFSKGPPNIVHSSKSMERSLPRALNRTIESAS
jgi:hypothetical protein